MKEFYKVPCNLYIKKADLIKMEQGDSGLGYVTIPDDQKEQYELVTRLSFQPVTLDQILDENTYDVVFIMD